jgi:hypothetical protein
MQLDTRTKILKANSKENTTSNPKKLAPGGFLKGQKTGPAFLFALDHS